MCASRGEPRPARGAPTEDSIDTRVEFPDPAGSVEENPGCRVGWGGAGGTNTPPVSVVAAVPGMGWGDRARDSGLGEGEAGSDVALSPAGLAYSNLVYDWVKAAVLFGVVNTVARLDHLDPPQAPKCITALYLFSET